MDLGTRSYDMGVVVVRTAPKRTLDQAWDRTRKGDMDATLAELHPPTRPAPSTTKPEYSGGVVQYYRVTINNSAVNLNSRGKPVEFTVECDDIIKALGMSFEEGCAFKALWRMAAAAQGKRKQGYTAKYDADKLVHYGQRIQSNFK